ncbi:MAG: hypothetical protein ACYCZX_09660 [Rhodospirillaceae bacterium]
MRTVLFVTSVVLSLGVAASSFAADAAQGYGQICDSARLRAVERADCRAQMKAASTEESRRDVFRTFDVKANGTLAQSSTGQSSTPAQ